MEQLTIYSLEKIKDNQIENKVIDFSDLKKGNQVDDEVFDFGEFKVEKNISVEDVMKIISTIKEIIKIKIKFLGFKETNNSLYNQAWNVFNNKYADLFRDKITRFDVDMNKTYNDLFVLLGGTVRKRIVIPERKCLFLEDIMNKLDDASNIEYKGSYYSKICLEKGMSFEKFMYTFEYDEMKYNYEKRLSDKKKVLNSVYDELSLYQEEVILNNPKCIMLECAKEVKVSIA